MGITINNEPIKHHYIPQFILRNFCSEGKKFEYFDKTRNVADMRTPNEVFFARNLYRDEINCDDNPTEIEQELANFENEASKLINGKIRDLDEITLTWQENDKLKLFLTVMSLRNKLTRDLFRDKLKESTREMYKQWQDDKNFEDLWKRNLGHIIRCRSIEEVHKSRNIDIPFKYFMLRDGYMNYEGWGKDYVLDLQKTMQNFQMLDMESKVRTLQNLPFSYFIILERRGDENFSLGDTFNVNMNGLLDNGQQIHMYSIYPISYKRVLLLASNGVEKAPESVRVFTNEVLKQPKVDREDNLIYKVKKIYSKDVEEINKVIRDNAIYGYIV